MSSSKIPSRSSSFDSNYSYQSEEAPRGSQSSIDDQFEEHNIEVLKELLPPNSPGSTPRLEPSRKWWGFSLPSLFSPKTSPKTITESRPFRVTTSLRSWILGWGAEARRVEADLLEGMEAVRRQSKAAARIESINPHPLLTFKQRRQPLKKRSKNSSQENWQPK